MSTISISFGLLIALFTILLLGWMRRRKPQPSRISITERCARLAD